MSWWKPSSPPIPIPRYGTRTHKKRSIWRKIPIMVIIQLVMFSALQVYQLTRITTAEIAFWITVNTIWIAICVCKVLAPSPPRRERKKEKL